MEYFYHNIVRKYVISFANLFSDIKILHESGDETEDKEIIVPIIYATKSKMYYEIRELTTERNKAIINTYLPRMGFFVSGMAYDSTRKLNNAHNIRLDNGEYLLCPGVPYNFTIELSVLTKKQDDLFQIIEQIGVQFTPDKTITIKEISGIDRDVSLNLDGINFSSIYEYSEEENRTISVDFTFTLKGYLYPKIKVYDTEGNIIKTIINNYGINIGEGIGTEVKQHQETPQSEIIKTITNFW